MIKSFKQAVRFFFSKGNVTPLLYDILGNKGISKQEKTEIPSVNMGYWKDIHPITKDKYHDSNEALFKLVFDGASFSSKDEIVLDVGCGFGTNMKYCLENSDIRKMIGLNISPNQIEWGRVHLAKHGLSSRAEIITDSATNMQFDDESVDKIVSIEAAFHFETREEFFKEAYRVLKPNGILSLADMIICKPTSLLQRLFVKIGKKSMAIPTQNIYNFEEYTKKIKESGLQIIEIESIGKHVISPFRKWFWTQSFKDILNCNWFWAVTSLGFMFIEMDYIRVVARK